VLRIDAKSRIDVQSAKRRILLSTMTRTPNNNLKKRGAGSQRSTVGGRGARSAATSTGRWRSLSPSTSYMLGGKHYGPGPDGKPIEYPLSGAFLTIEDAVAEAKRVGASGPNQIFPFGGRAATGYGIRKGLDAIVSRGAR
jgi:hypothetical protein